MVGKENGSEDAEKKNVMSYIFSERPNNSLGSVNNIKQKLLNHYCQFHFQFTPSLAKFIFRFTGVLTRIP